MRNKVKRIAPPKFKVGRYVLNEYELRNLMLEVCKGERDSGIRVKGENGEVAYINADGTLSARLSGLAINSRFTLDMMAINKGYTLYSKH